MLYSSHKSVTRDSFVDGFFLFLHIQNITKVILQIMFLFLGTPEIGGLTTIQAMEIIQGCRGLNIVGGDLVEV